MEAPHKPNGRPDAATPWSKSVMDGSYHTTEECGGVGQLVEK
jgi:hypothetical protein